VGGGESWEPEIDIVYVAVTFPGFSGGNEILDQEKKESSLIPLQETRDIMALMDSIRYSWDLRYEGEKG